jgi:hypothetical protein
MIANEWLESFFIFDFRVGDWDRQASHRLTPPQTHGVTRHSLNSLA